MAGQGAEQHEHAAGDRRDDDDPAEPVLDGEWGTHGVMMGQSPSEVVVCGGGRHNPQIMKALAERLPMPVRVAEDHGWRGDAIEAEAFAYLAARTKVGLPISFPKTTGVPQPMAGGRIAEPVKG